MEEEQEAQFEPLQSKKKVKVDNQVQLGENKSQEKQEQQQNNEQKEQNGSSNKKQNEKPTPIQHLSIPKTENKNLGSNNSLGSKSSDKKQVFPKKQVNNKTFDREYKIEEDAPFHKGQDVPFGFIAETLEHIQEVKGKDSKGIKVDILSKMFRSIIQLNPEQLVPTYYFCILRINPDYELNELGIGKEILNKVLQKATGRSAKQLRDSLQELGDMGQVAMKSKSNQSSISTFFAKKVEKPDMTMLWVYNNLVKIAYTSGNNSNANKEGIIVKMMIDSTAVENKFIIRFLEKNLRIGSAEKTMQEGLTKAFFDTNYFNLKTNMSYSENQAEKYDQYSVAIKRALCEYPNYTEVIEQLFKIGKDIEKLEEVCKATPGIPCKPMLAKPTKSIQVILKRFENQKFTCEYKYDGLRGQIHYINKEVKIFSRNLENMTETYPDIVQLVKKQIGSEQIEDFILDSEIVAFDAKTNKIKSFQELSTRGRKGVSLDEINVKVCIFMFDLLYINGKSLLQENLAYRRSQIKENFAEIEGQFQMATHIDSEDVDEIQAFLLESIKVGCEGLMVKTLEEEGSSYEPAKRSFKWLKLKKDYLDSGLGDSFDLVPIGAMLGGGKRKGLYGAYLLASYNEDMERYETICKTGTGFSDEQLEEFHKFFQDKIVNNPPVEYNVKDFKADVWFDPSVVWEIKGADLQISPVYTCAVGEADENKGIGLRFPRLIRVREDKKPWEATTGVQIYEIYKQQSTVDNLQDDDDFY